MTYEEVKRRAFLPPPEEEQHPGPPPGWVPPPPPEEMEPECEAVITGALRADGETITHRGGAWTATEDNQSALYARGGAQVALTGAVLEEANYRAKLHLTPAYYDITLKGKYSRDPESIAMLDLIFANRVVDLGDSLFCVNVRDGFVFSMFSGNSRDLVSTVKKNEKIVNKTAQKMIDELRNGN